MKYDFHVIYVKKVLTRTDYLHGPRQEPSIDSETKVQRLNRHFFQQANDLSNDCEMDCFFNNSQRLFRDQCS